MLKSFDYFIKSILHHFYYFFIGEFQQKNTNLIMKGRKYLSNIFCNKHPDQRLNLVCIQKSCPNRGLICQLCRGDESEMHLLHQEDILPFKYFLESLEANIDSTQVDFSSIVEQSCLSRLQKLRDQMLGRLAISIQELSHLVADLQMRIINDFQEKKDEIRQKGMIFRSYKNCIDRCIIHNIRKEEKFELMAEIRKIVEHVKLIEGKKGSFKYQLDLTGKQIIADYIEQNQLLKIDCQRLQIELKTIFSKQKNVRNLKKYHQQLIKRQLQAIKQQNRGLLQAKRSAQIAKISKVEDQKIQKKKEEKEKRIDKKKQESGKKSKKEIKPIKEQLNDDKFLQKLNTTLPSPLKQALLDFVPKQDPPSYKKQPKISFADFDQDQEKIGQSIKQKGHQGKILFSSLFKGMTIKITKSGRVAKQTSSEEKVCGFVVISESLDKCKKISFKITKIKCSILMGIAKHQIIAANKYAFNSSTLNHGGYLMGNKGVAFSSTQPLLNKHQTNFSFEEGDIVNITYDGGDLFFQRVPNKKSTAQVQEFVLNVAADEEEAKTYNFCVFLEGSGDSVQLI